MWKVVYDAKEQKTIAFYFPNVKDQRISQSELPNFAISVAELEKRTGINFHPNLPAELANIESKAELDRWTGLVR
jgi:DNA/RNA endonuclease G (NUC1)